MRVHGRAAHAGLEPEKGINALVAAAEQVWRIATSGDPATARRSRRRSPRRTADNVVPAEARFSVNVRVVEAGEKERVEAAMAALTSVPGAASRWRGGIGRPPMHESASADLFPLAQRRRRHRAAGTGGVAVGGGSDGNFTAAIGVATLDGLGAVGGGAHADHEHVRDRHVVDRTRLLAALIAAVRSERPRSEPPGRWRPALGSR